MLLVQFSCWTTDLSPSRMIQDLAVSTHWLHAQAYGHPIVWEIQYCDMSLWDAVARARYCGISYFDWAGRGAAFIPLLKT